MNIDMITQFVGFITKVDPETFIEEWELYNKRLGNKKSESILLELFHSSCRFKYISLHHSTQFDLFFNFMKGRNSDQFASHNVKVVQAGGYMLRENDSKYDQSNESDKLIVFIADNKINQDIFKEYPFYHMNIYEPYYESCSYTTIIELFADPKNADDLVKSINKIPGVESGIYRQCVLSHHK